ncbi:sorting nexin-31 [Pseudophryne corroboree]|uniref:sorting nexin-31 n=1 Tax=Pseudophryne corroboree TaxID=495146 RepID=UPI00308151B8
MPPRCGQAAHVYTQHLRQHSYLYIAGVMDICIPVTEELVDSFGGSYLLYSVYLDGFILFKVRYKDLNFWDEQMHRVFGNRLPKFPPKYFLAMTKPMVDKRRLMLETYLQKIVSDPVVSGSEIFITFFKKLQLDTFKVSTRKLIIGMYLPDGRQVKVDTQTSDTADRVLEAALYKLHVSRELMEYFCLFITHKASNGDFTVVKRLAHFEIPFMTIWNIHDDRFQIDIRKRYMNPYTDVMLMGCIAAVDLLYAQAVQELEMKWCRPTEEQIQKLQNFIKIDNKVQFLQLMQQVEHYGHLQLGPCTTNHPETNTTVTVSVGSHGLYCSFQTPSNQTEMIRLPISNISCWHVTMLPQTEKQNRALEFKLEYMQGHSLKRITLWTEQAFLLSSCLEKILSEQPVTFMKEELEIQAGKKTLPNTFTRKHKQTAVSNEKESFLCYMKQSDVFEATDFNL